MCEFQVTSKMASTHAPRESYQERIELLSQLQQCLITAARTYKAEAHRAAFHTHHWQADLQQDIKGLSGPASMRKMHSHDL